MTESVQYEKLGVFYLGRPYDPERKQPGEGLVLYPSKDLTTHAVCVGMTGSGKTGLCIGLLEEAAMDGIPAIIIDPKGDMPNLMLTFPELRAEDFLPWVNEDDARRKGQSTVEFAEAQARLWKQGLADWGQDGARVARLRTSAECLVYTPGSSAGIPVSILKSLDSPPAAIVGDPELLGERVETTVTGILGLVGIKSDPLRSREHILLSHLLTRLWQEGRAVDMGSLISQIQSPPMERIGVMNVESFFPADERFELALMLNNLLASPSFGRWQQGQPLDIGSMLHTQAGKPRLAIVSIAHLSERERMFFVSLMLNEVVGWVRSQPGTTSLRAILYMDEMFGYFPPVENPPSKKPLLTLLKQARAHGLGVVLTTQNPVDLDYKGLSNTGTWFIGRLQTDRDKARVIEGLEGASASTGAGFDRGRMERLIAGLGSRVFLLHDVHEDTPTVFQTRWVMSYLRGPLTREQIERLMLGRTTEEVVEPPREAPSAPRPRPAVDAVVARPVLPPRVPQYFVPVRGASPSGYDLVYEPVVLASARMAYRDRKSGAQTERNFVLMAEPAKEAIGLNWSRAEELDFPVEDLEREPAARASFGTLPAAAGQATAYTAWKRELASWLYGNETIELFSSRQFKLTSVPGDSEKDFRLRLVQAARERRDADTEKLRAKYETKTARLRDRIMKAEQTVEREQEQVKHQKMQTAISFGAGILGSFLGGPASTIGRMTTAARGASRAMKEKQDVGRATESLRALKRKLAMLEEDFKSDIEQLGDTSAALSEPLERATLRPMKKDISVRLVALGWIPMWQSRDGTDIRSAF